MYLSNFLPLALAATVIASPLQLVPRDLPTINNAISRVQTALATLDTAIKGLSPNGNAAAQAAQLTSLSQAVQTALTTGTTQIQGTSALNLVDALQVSSTSQALTNQANTTISDLIAAKPIIDAAGLTATTLNQLRAQRTATQAFGAAIVSKIPDIAKAAGQAIANQAVAVVDRGITAYGGTPGAKRFIRAMV